MPDFPLPRRSVFFEMSGDGGKVRAFDEDATAVIQDREQSLWSWAWSTPQANAWAQPSESWRLYTIAMWVRTYVLCESSDATAADKSSLHRFADQIGMTPAGLRENGWAIAADEVAAKAADRTEQAAPPKRERRLRSVAGE